MRRHDQDYVDAFKAKFGMVSSTLRSVRPADRPDIRLKLERQMASNKVVVFSKSSCAASMQVK
jgi:hypothetical protein